VLSDARLRRGLAQQGRGSDKFLIAGKKVTRASIIRILDARAALDRETHRARARYHVAVAAQRKLVRETRSLLSSLVAQLRTTESAQELLRFGLTPAKKRRKATAEEMLVTILKRRATRARNAKRRQ
jgi:hypothetical protein